VEPYSVNVESLASCDHIVQAEPTNARGSLRRCVKSPQARDASNPPRVPKGMPPCVPMPTRDARHRPSVLELQDAAACRLGPGRRAQDHSVEAARTPHSSSDSGTDETTPTSYDAEARGLLPLRDSWRHWAGRQRKNLDVPPPRIVHPDEWSQQARQVAASATPSSASDSNCWQEPPSSGRRPEAKSDSRRRSSSTGALPAVASLALGRKMIQSSFKGNSRDDKGLGGRLYNLARPLGRPRENSIHKTNPTA